MNLKISPIRPPPLLKDSAQAQAQALDVPVLRRTSFLPHRPGRSQDVLSDLGGSMRPACKENAGAKLQAEVQKMTELC